MNFVFPLALQMPKIAAGANKRIIKIVSSESQYNYGPVLIVTQNGFAAYYISDSNNDVTSIFTSPDSKIVATRDGLTTTYDLGTVNAHSIVILGGDITRAQLFLSD